MTHTGAYQHIHSSVVGALCCLLPSAFCLLLPASLVWAETEASASAAPAMVTPANQAAAQGYDFGNLTSETLVKKSWEALGQSDHAAVQAYTKKCIDLYQNKALDQQASLTDFAPKDKALDYWALNDVATCQFIFGQSLLAQGKVKEAQDVFTAITQQFPYAQAWDPQGWFWKVADGANDKLATIGTPYDFGDYKSQTLTVKAWEALIEKDHRGVELFTKKCLKLYEPEAKKQQASLSEFAPKDKAFTYWALNDVATCYFILGQSLLAQNKVKEAQAAFNTVIEQFSFAQAWDPKGWFWKVADAANDKLATIGTSYDFGDYTSQTLAVKSWEALGKNDHRGIELYTKKCFDLYEQDAKKQQAGLSDFAPKEKAFDAWALNDVATCYFILGESLMAQQRYQEAKAAFERVVNDFSFAQCWDPKGWFWKVAVASRGRINKILALSGN
ncbi:MAG: tetratricopeptide repeat protein [Candidatus Omnitrophica bacterium]|nr:tetratricopeptide repeat protein [Candidatus Omnitrophota bacterium]